MPAKFCGWVCMNAEKKRKRVFLCGEKRERKKKAPRQKPLFPHNYFPHILFSHLILRFICTKFFVILLMQTRFIKNSRTQQSKQDYGGGKILFEIFLIGIFLILTFIGITSNNYPLTLFAYGCMCAFFGSIITIMGLGGMKQ